MVRYNGKPVCVPMVDGIGFRWGVAQWQSIRLLIGRLVVRVHPPQLYEARYRAAVPGLVH